ncbi:hypothetical protein D920_00039 [Enterococcus faecalis 13-SD-W-01]|nr:hypothetical protein D920_00039 [Enterococcus faecalis 13-SD-W-01]
MLKLKNKLIIVGTICSLLMFNADTFLSTFIGQTIVSGQLKNESKIKYDEETVWMIDQPFPSIISGVFGSDSKEYKIIYRKENREKHKTFSKKRQKINVLNNHHGSGGGSHNSSSSQIARIARVMSGTLLYGEFKESERSIYFLK